MSLSTLPAVLAYGSMRDGIPSAVPFAGPVDGGETEWVADLIDTYKCGDLDSASETLESLLGRLKRASKARPALAQVPPLQLRAALEERATRTASGV